MMLKRIFIPMPGNQWIFLFIMGWHEQRNMLYLKMKGKKKKKIEK